jgi:type I restriction enzyme S subunit
MRRHVEPDDFVISMRSFQGGLERSWATGCIRSSYVVLQPSPEVHVGYFAHLFKSQPYIKALQATSNFIRDGQDLNFNNFCLVDLPLPPKGDQQAIAKYLEHVDRRIRRYIRAKQKLIKLLEEQKQAIIHQAVTRGLDPNVRMKPSGVEWLGEVPEHWRVIPLKFLSSRIQNGATPPTSERRFYESGTVPWFGPSSIGFDSEVGAPVRHLSESAFSEGRARKIFGPAILIIVIGATAGKMALLRADGATNQQITAFQLRRDLVVPEFAIQQVRLSENWLRSTASTATIPILDSQIVCRLSVAVPPEAEQLRIMTLLTPRTAHFVSALARARDQIALIRELQRRLIADVVTGKLDVRAASAALPEELDELADDVAIEDDAPEDDALDPTTAETDE